MYSRGGRPVNSRRMGMMLGWKGSDLRIRYSFSNDSPTSIDSTPQLKRTLAARGLAYPQERIGEHSKTTASQPCPIRLISFKSLKRLIGSMILLSFHNSF